MTVTSVTLAFALVFLICPFVSANLLDHENDTLAKVGMAAWVLFAGTGMFLPVAIIAGVLEMYAQF